MDTPALPVVQAGGQVVATQFMPVMDIQQAVERRNAIVSFVKQVMVEDVDFGKIPGVDKPTLLQPGAEKLISLFGMTPVMELLDRVEDWNGKDNRGEPFFYYRYRCTMMRGGLMLGVEEASANSREVKYRYRWVPGDQVPANVNKDGLEHRDGTISEFAFAVDKAETSGKYGKPAEYWKQFQDALSAGTARQIKRKDRKGKEHDAIEIGAVMFRIPNPEIADVVNTLQQMAEKRAKIRATRSCTGASEFFTQDVEDMQIIDVTPTVVRDDPKPEARREGAGVTGAAADKPAAAADQQGAVNRPPPKTGPTPGVGPQPAAAAKPKAFDVDDAALQLKGAQQLKTLTEIFNSFPAEVKRPGGVLHKGFLARREELQKKRP